MTQCCYITLSPRHGAVQTVIEMDRASLQAEELGYMPCDSSIKESEDTPILGLCLSFSRANQHALTVATQVLFSLSAVLVTVWNR